MTDKDKRVVESFGNLLPKLSELDKERLLIFGEGMAVKAEEYRKTNPSAPDPQGQK